MGGRHDVYWSLVLMFCFAWLSLRRLSVPYMLLHPRHTIFLLCVANRAVVKYLSLTPLPSYHFSKFPCILGWRYLLLILILHLRLELPQAIIHYPSVDHRLA